MPTIKERLTAKISRNNIEPFLEKHASTGKTLDIGGGNTPYRTYFPNTVCVDIEKRPTVDVVGDAHDLPFEKNTFDTVLCTGVLNALHTPQQAVHEMYRVLKPGGKVILATDSVFFPLHGVPYDYFRPTPYGLHLLFERAGFKDIDIQAESTHFSLAVVLQRIAMQCDFKGGKITRGLFYLSAQILARTPSLITHEYGNVYRTKKVDSAAPMGLFMVCKK